ncbi:MAG: hypothetical protein NC081_07925 [Roseburia sp.]|nr:hypothetical protein [Roseburia sp.]
MDRIDEFRSVSGTDDRIRSEGKRQGINVYQMSLTFLKRCNEVGLFYR